MAAARHGSDNDPSGLTRFDVKTCVFAASGGLMFGYDIGISGGVTSMQDFLKKFFPAVNQRSRVDEGGVVNQYCTFNSHPVTLFTSSLYLAALASSLLASSATRRFGRRISMLIGGLVFLAGVIVNVLAMDLWMLIVGRILLGLGVGFAIQSVPIYMSEMAPYKYRGALNNNFQLAITAGILLANLVNFCSDKIKGGWGWRVSLGGAAVPAILLSAVAWNLPNSPNSMIDRGELQQAREMLRRIRGVGDEGIEAEFGSLVAASEAAREVSKPWRNLLRRKYRPQLTMAVLIPAFQQLTGINLVMFYGPLLFRSLGLGSNASLFSAVITGVVNVLATLAAIYGTDRWGRRKLFLVGGFQMFVFQVLLTILIAIKYGVTGTQRHISLHYWYFSVAILVTLCGYVAAFAWSWGPLGWLVPSEIFPLEIRSTAQSLAVSVNMLFTFIIAQVFLGMLCYLKFGIFMFFAGFVAIMTLFVYEFVPQTKNIPIENMAGIWKRHWYWERFMGGEDDNVSDFYSFVNRLGLPLDGRYFPNATMSQADEGTTPDHKDKW